MSALGELLRALKRIIINNTEYEINQQKKGVRNGS
jgi:hypothetical protein